MHGAPQRLSSFQKIRLSRYLAIYSNDRTIRKSDGYQSHPWTRQKIPSLFNCVDPAWAARKKKTIRPATAQPALEIHHASVESNVEILANIVRDGKPHDLSQIGRLLNTGLCEAGKSN